MTPESVASRRTNPNLSISVPTAKDLMEPTATNAGQDKSLGRSTMAKIEQTDVPQRSGSEDHDVVG